MRLFTVTLAVSLLALAACSSSSEGDGIHPDPAGSGSGSAGTETGTGAGGGTPSDQNNASVTAWLRFQGEYNSDDQEPAAEGAPVPPPRRLLGCVVEAPEIGDRVIYVERSDPASDGPPDRQFVMSFSGPPEDSSQATATIHRLIDPTEWTGHCEPGATMPLLGPLTSEDGCTLTITMDEEIASLKIKPEGDVQMTAACIMPEDTQASTIAPDIRVYGIYIEWADRIVDEDGVTRDDPVRPAPDDYASNYKMSLRSEPAELPSR